MDDWFPLMLLGLLCWLGGFAIGHWNASRGKEIDHKHDWSKWEVDVATTRSLRVADVFQTRRCNTCGLTQSQVGGD